MIEIVSNNVLELGMVKPLILGGYVTTKKKIYSKYIPEAKYLSEDGNRLIEKIIEEIKIRKKLSKRSLKNFDVLVNNNVNNIDSILFACTELPIVFQSEKLQGLRIFDSANIYAQESINYAYEPP